MPEQITKNNSDTSKASILVPLAYLTLYIVWGSTYFFIKMAVSSIPPLYVISGRFVIGGPLLLLLTAVGGQIERRPTWKEVGASLLLGSLLLIGGNGLVTLAEKKVDSYLVALIIATTPMVVAFYDLVLLRKRIPAIRLGGITIGIAGVACLLYNGQSISTSLPPEILAAIGGVALWALATSLGHKIKTFPNAVTNSGIQMSLIGVLCLILISLFGPSLREVAAAASLQSVLALVFLATIGSLAFAAYNYLVAHEPAIRVVSYALVNPVIATLLGLIIGDESPVPLLALGLPLILVGVTLMLYGESAITYLVKQKRRPGSGDPWRA
jgi:drug/metabolite transporter (DMT)-like permease